MKESIEKGKVTVILTSYNKPKTVTSAIESVMNQSYKNWELFIMDDSSNIQTHNEIRRIIGSLTQPSDKRIFFYNSMVKDQDRYKTTRYATLINQAIELSSGEFITYLTDDNYYLKNRLQVMVQHLNRYPKFETVYSKQVIKFLDARGKVLKERIRGTKGILNKPQNKVDHCSVMHRRVLCERIKKRYGSCWDDDSSNWHNGDAAFWDRMVKYSPFYPIDEVLDICFKTPHSFQTLNAYVPSDLPNGIVIKDMSNQFFLIEDGSRRLIEIDKFKHNYNHNVAVNIPDPILLKYPIGEPINTKIFNEPNLFPNYRFVFEEETRKVYFTENHQIRRIRSQNLKKHFNLTHSNMIDLKKQFIKKFPIGPDVEWEIVNSKSIMDGLLYKFKLNYYVAQNHKLCLIPNKILKRLKYHEGRAILLNRILVDRMEKGVPFNWNVKRY
ncbi:glycosyltransferase family 2 protein [Bacillus carboniphilus]|uniref:Glycosyltransferase family 2 protein n=1 Tax=Bacillus carboniphilus TaxID=86663 RepID=A0ABY9JZE0_9BACI|nr:glycosyltransferase family 2 protein [Bacillus carboniphilus]WLR42965.1 glycosyltransferase family 2 protein [Bacillus carboniphilus]